MADGELSPAENRILREAYKSVGNRPDRVYLKNLRASTGLSKATFDSAVLKLQTSGHVHAYRIDDHNDVVSKGLVGSEINVAGSPRHVLYLSESGQAAGAALQAKVSGGSGGAGLASGSRNGTGGRPGGVTGG